VGSGEEALDFVADQEPNLILLDYSLPGEDGLAICKRLREWSEVPVILVTAADTPQMKVAALEQGADDYLTKPFHTGELVARINAVLRRVNHAKPADKAIRQIDDLRVNSMTREVFRGDEEIKLTKMEFDILAVFLRNPDKIITHHQLLDLVWGPGYDDVRSVHVHVCNLRRKVEKDPTKRRRILTVQGIGYRFRVSEE
jgi:two-component system KDP operon response regulator KdpE